MKLRKVFEIGKIDYLEIGRRTCPVTIEMELRDADTEKPELSICGTIWNHKRTDCYQGGQCIDTILKYFPHNDLVKELHRLWKRWHLNSMKAGDAEQEKAVEKYLETNRYDYKEVCKYLESINLLEHNGYRYGTKWLYELIDSQDLTKIHELLKW